MHEPENHLVRIFKDAAAHREVAGIIARHLSHEEDIRSVALDGMELGSFRNILDLGCGFGFFTEGLRGRVHPEARITGVDRFPEYEWFYFQTCEQLNIKKRFLSSGSRALREMEDRSFDLILCSYALYFFPEMIREISRVMKKEGLFIAITHATSHLHPFTNYIREVLLQNGFSPEDEIPYERLINKFSDKNGKELLGPFFQTISEKSYRCNLVFEPAGWDDFTTYFNFKRSFFIPHSLDEDDRLHHRVLNSVKEFLTRGNNLIINKDDVIYLCSHPVDL